MYQSHPADATTTRQPSARRASTSDFRSGSSSIDSTTPIKAASPAVTDPKIDFRAWKCVIRPAR